jgi:60 kDa SS-A/Ro ribonucleoprotein
MSKFNSTVIKPKTKTTNLAGGDAYSQTDELALVSLLLTSFVSDQAYRTGGQSLEELKKLVSKIKDKEFVAKAAIYARDKFGMRSISQALAAELTSDVAGTEWGKNFFDKIVIRVDDMTEILSYYLANKTAKSKPKFPNALKKGFAKAFDKFDNYQLSKYQASGKEVKLIDIVNIVHPIPTDKNSSALEALVKGELKNTETWEAKLSQAGQLAENEEDLTKLKGDAWVELLTTRKLGYFALLRNLRNIITQAPNAVELACTLLTDDKLIKNSRVMPFRFDTAYDEISKLGSSTEVRKVLVAISNALEISVVNVPKLDNLLVVIDVSGSMGGRPSQIASLFGAVLAKANNCDVMTFSNYAQYVAYNPLDSVMSIRSSFRFSGGGTNFRDIFNKTNKSYDNVVILSDMQGWIGSTTPTREFNDYKGKFSCNPHVYSWDLAGYGTLQLPEKQVYCLAGFSDKVFQIMELLKTDKNAMINEIKSIEL